MKSGYEMNYNDAVIPGGMLAIIDEDVLITFKIE